MARPIFGRLWIQQIEAKLVRSDPGTFRYNIEGMPRRAASARQSLVRTEAI